MNKIFDKTDGRCHIGWKKFAFSNYGEPGRRGTWEVPETLSAVLLSAGWLDDLLERS